VKRKKLNERRKATGIILAAIIVASAVAIALPSIPKASALPQGADVAVQSHNVTLGWYNITGNTWNDGYDLGEGVNEIHTHIVNCSLEMGAGATINLSLSYLKSDGSSASTWVNFTANQTICTWDANVDTVVSDLTNITSMGFVGTQGLSGDLLIVATVTREGLYQGVGATDTARGGFITDINLDVVQRTAKWQGYYGNVSGDIRLTDSAGNIMYKWTWDVSLGGEVLATTNTSIPPWESLDTNNTAAFTEMITSLWGWDASQSDNATNTLNTAVTITIAGDSSLVMNATTADMLLLTGQGWRSGAIATLNPTAKAHYVFVGLIMKGKTAFDGTTKDFQMIVPVGDVPSATETYYFYVELT